MPFLKNKIKLKADPEDEYDMEELDNCDPEAATPSSFNESSSLKSFEPDFTFSPNRQESILPTRGRRNKPTNPDGHSKNIVKNYGKALCGFASSEIAIPYLELIIARESFNYVKISDFMDHIKSKKNGINSIESLRRLLVKNEHDDMVMAAYKRLFQEVSIVFLKYFCVNWIFGGRLLQKNAHLKFRFKMLRRIQNPQHFTYLQTVIKPK